LKNWHAASTFKQDGEKDAIGNFFGTIFDMLFLDRDYWIKVKIFANGKDKGWTGYFYELMSFFNKEKENLM